MQTVARVLKVSGNMARVVCKRQSACDTSCKSCENKDSCAGQLLFTNDSSVELDVYNTVGAKVGDTVELSSSTFKTLVISLVVFVFPVLFSVIGYVVCDKLTESIYLPALVLAAVFAVAFAATAFCMNEYAKKNIRIEIVKIVEESAEKFTAHSYDREN